MGNMKPIDSAVVKNETYDVLSADTMGGEYIETIGAACQNPDGYTSGSLFLGKDNDVQHLYRATAAIALGETIILDTNCVYTTVSGELEGKAEESEVTSLNEALANVEDVINNNGAKNLLPNTATSQVINGITWTVNSDGTVTASGTASSNSSFFLATTQGFIKSNRYRLSGCPINGGSEKSWRVQFYDFGTSEAVNDYGEGAEFNYNGTNSCTVELRIKSGETVSNLVFKPMITLASQPNSGYEHYVPYAKTNRELTESVTNVSKMGASSISDFFTASSDVAQVYDSSFIVKNGNMINIYLSIKLSASLGSSIANLGNIAAGLRPYGAFYDIASKWNGDAITPTPLHVRTDGVIRLLNAVANTDYSFNIVYLI